MHRVVGRFPTVSSPAAVLATSAATYFTASRPARSHGRVTYAADSGTTVAMDIVTKCGRRFDTTIFRQVVDASQDQRWVEAIQRGLQEDAEYMAAVKERGGVSNELKSLMNQHGGGRDAEGEAAFLLNLRERLQRDEHLSLCLCALQDAYVRIRKHRDEDRARRMANSQMTGEREDPMMAFKRAQAAMGSSKPPMF